jgi:hypothetical protein
MVPPIDPPLPGAFGMDRIEISDVAIWFKHVHARSLLTRLQALEPEGEITLSVNNIIGRWKRMKTGKDGRFVHAIRPIGPMKQVWQDWYKTRKGERVDVQEVQLADEFLTATVNLMAEWSSAEDESAFCDL